MKLFDFGVLSIALSGRSPGTGRASPLLARHGEEVALMLRGERQPLSAQEQDDVLSHRISHVAYDLVVPTWNAAFVYDTPRGAQAALDVFELANSQLLEFRYYDDLLDVELGRIYAQLQKPRWSDTLTGRATSAPRTSCTRRSSM